MEMTIWKGRRWSAANAYLRPALKRPNIELRTGTRAERIVFEGRRAVGVVARRRGRWRRSCAKKEVILAASAFNSPQLLMLSGIGPAEHLRAHGIEVVVQPAGRRRQSAGSPGGLRAAGVPQADHAQRASRALCARARSGWSGCSSAAGSVPATISRPAPSSARRPAFPTPTCSSISCRPPSATTAAPRPRRTVSRCISARCARPRAARCG